MNNNTAYNIALKYAYALAYWIFAMIMFYLFRYMGLDEQAGIDIEHKELQSVNSWFLISIIGGSIIGTFYFLVDRITQTKKFKRKSFGHALIVKMLLYMIMLVLTGNILMEILEYIFDIQMVEGALVKKTFFWSFVAYFTLMNLVYSFVQMVSVKFGKGVLMNMLMGKYRSPKEERRIFMFMDLKSSTTIAEELGHFQYSKLIQQCFYDLNEVIYEYDGEIYQYVGDEVVISWSYDNGIKQNKCIDCFFAFQQLLESKRDYYQKNFGLMPKFKAGLHGGTLIVTEVGVMKKEIAYHGDVINTAARIQGECNKYNEKLLVSQELLGDLSMAQRTIKMLGEVVLKGKLQPIAIHAVH